MQIVIAWVVGSPLLAVLVGKMISLGDRPHLAMADAAGTGSIIDRFEPTAALHGAAEAAA